MAQLLFLALLVGGGWFLYRKFVADAEKLSRRRREQERERQTGANGTLIKDPETGEYRLRKDED
jgi:membrane protein implicated in regulation of membrane protease activity